MCRSPAFSNASAGRQRAAAVQEHQQPSRNQGLTHGSRREKGGYRGRGGAADQGSSTLQGAVASLACARSLLSLGGQLDSAATVSCRA